MGKPVFRFASAFPRKLQNASEQHSPCLEAIEVVKKRHVAAAGKTMIASLTVISYLLSPLLRYEHQSLRAQ